MQLKTLLVALEQPPIRVLSAPSEKSESGNVFNEEREITALAYDSRQVQPDGLFIAVPGDHTDGRRFLQDAAQRGAYATLGIPLEASARASLPLPYIEVPDVRIALANLACAFYDNPSAHLCTFGVTGTDGKTTTSNLISTILETAGFQTGLMTTANFKISGQEWENATRQSTLEALEVQQFLRRMLDAGVTHAIVEATSHGLALQRVRGCQFDVGVVTNITHEHLDFHGTIENYRRAKARLFEMLDPKYVKDVPTRPIAILNRDDVSYNVLRPYCRVPILDYGIDPTAAVRAVDVQLHAHSTSFRVIFPDSELHIETQLVGSFNISNCLAAIAATYSQGVKPAAIARGLAKVTGVTGRMENIVEGQPFTVIVDYAHTPDSLEKVLATLRPLTSGKLLVVFGSAGERDVQKRPIMGRIAAQMTEFFVITDEDPREEERESILHAIAQGAKDIGKREGRDFLCLADRTQAIATAFSHAQPGDTVLLAGKGHEQSIIIGREKLPWDDRTVARKELGKLGYRQERY
ncbi:MAG: UDP-N-acetylmuramoyl-L-alanyl-D-glutamate--2,6-diaminopimelate ligase [Ktedonobacteraceae bacterium]